MSASRFFGTAAAFPGTGMRKQQRRLGRSTSGGEGSPAAVFNVALHENRRMGGGNDSANMFIFFVKKRVKTIKIG